MTGDISGVSFLEDWGTGHGVGAVINTAPNYPVAVAHNLRNMSVNLLGVVPLIGGALVFDLLQNGIPVPGFTIVYGPLESGIKSVLAGPTAYAIGDTFDIRIITGANPTSINVSATVGIE